MTDERREMEAVSHITKNSRRVRKAIAKDQHRRLTLIGFVQFLFAAHMLVVLLTATSSAGTKIGGRIVVLLLSYVCFALWTLYKSSRKGLAWYEVIVSMALDFALCMEVMFYQYSTLSNSEGALGVAPMFSYVYLFIAMRCLHFRTSYVLVAGCMATISWGALLTVTLSANGGTLHGITFQDIMLSGVVDKLLSLGAVTAIIAMIAREARAYFESSIVRGVAGNKLAALVSQEVADQVLLAGGLKPGQGRISHASILMMDIRDFSKFATSMGPDHVLSLLQEYQSLMVPIIAQRGGCIDKFMGDGILAHFGAIRDSETAASDALKTIEDLMQATEKWNAERRAKKLPVLEFGAAVASGKIIFGALGGVSKTEYTIIGHAVNLTAKLEKHTKTMRVRALCTQATFDEATAQGFKPLFKSNVIAGAQVAGITEPIGLVVLYERQASTAPSSPSARTTPPPPPTANMRKASSS